MITYPSQVFPVKLKLLIEQTNKSIEFNGVFEARSLELPSWKTHTVLVSKIKESNKLGGLEMTFLLSIDQYIDLLVHFE